MTDTSVVTKHGQKPRDVDYTLDVLDGDIPDSEIVRRSPLEDQLDKVKGNAEYHGKWVRIGSYANGSAATAAANVLRKRHGDVAAVEGWSVKPKRSEDDRTFLYVKFEPGAIVEGARAEFEQRLKDRAAKYAAKKAANGAKDGAKGQDASADAPKGPTPPSPAPAKPASK